MVEGDDPHAFPEVFRATAVACCWPEKEWALRLPPALSGEAQAACCRQLSAYPQQAVVNHFGLTPEDYCQIQGGRSGMFHYRSSPPWNSGCVRTLTSLPSALSAQVLASTHTAPHSPGTEQVPGQACWKCGQLGHLQRECPQMEVGEVFSVAGPPTNSLGLRGTYSVLVRCQAYPGSPNPGLTRGIVGGKVCGGYVCEWGLPRMSYAPCPSVP